jgi:hypothetical protein
MIKCGEKGGMEPKKWPNLASMEKGGKREKGARLN